MVWRLAQFELDDERGALHRQGRPVPLEPKPLALLLHLCRRHPEVVSKRELRQVLWPGVAVTDGSLTRAVHALRQALETPSREGVVRTVRDRGYQLAVPVTRVPSEAERPPGGFVGREAVLAQLDTHLRETFAGHGGFVAVCGEPGVGKTTTLRAFAARAPARVLWGRSDANEGAPPFWPWRQVLRALAQRSGSPLGKDLLGEMVQELPERARGAAHSARRPLEPERARFQLLDAVTTRLQQASQVEPLVLALEDLHTAGGDSLLLLRFLVREITDARILVLGSYRNVGARPNRALEETLADLAGLPQTHPTIVLERLSETEVHALLEQNALAAHPQAVVRLRQWTGGSPLFLREVVRMLRLRGPTRRLAAEDIEALEVPESVSAIVRGRVEQLAPRTRSLLTDAAVAGVAVPLDVLAAMARVRASELREPLDEGQAAGLIDGSDHGLRFSHELIRDAVYGMLASGERSQVHRRVGEALESLHRQRPDPPLAELAHHFAAAVPAVPEEKARRYSLAAAEQARGQLAFERAARHWARALALSGPDGDPEDHCDLLLALGEAELLSGANDAAMERVREAAHLARRLRSVERLARAALAAAGRSIALLPNPEALSLLSEASAALARTDSPLRIRVLAQLARQLQFARRGEEAAVPLAQALAAAEQQGDPLLGLEVLLERLHVLQMGPPTTPVAERLRLADEVLRQAAELADPDRVLQARRQRIVLLLQLARLETLDAELEQFRRESAAIEMRTHRFVAANLGAMRALLAGDFARAKQHIAVEERVADPFSPADRRFTPLTQRLLIPGSDDERIAQLRAMERMIAEFPQVTPWHLARVWPLDDLGDRDALGRLLDECTAGGVDGGLSGTSVDNVLLASMAKASHRLGRSDLAPAIRERLQRHQGHLVETGWGSACFGPADLYLGLLAALLGRRDEAERHLDTALELVQRVPSPPWEVATRLARAELLADPRPRQAADEAARAGLLAARLGMAPQAREADGLRRSLGGLRLA